MNADDRAASEDDNARNDNAPLTAEDTEFLEADALLATSLPRLPKGVPLTEIKDLVLPTPDKPSSCMFWEGDDTLLSVERLVVTPDTPPLVTVVSGISRKDLGSGGKRWDGSLAMARWIARCAADGESPVEDKCVLELGAGCAGCPGIVSWRDGGAKKVVVTEGPAPLVDMLRRNLLLNEIEVGGNHDSSRTISACQLIWKCSQRCESDDGAAGKGRAAGGAPATPRTIGADVILAAEPIWAGCDPRPLVETIQRCLLLGRQNRLAEEREKGAEAECHDVEEKDKGCGVCYIVMPRGGRGAEGALKEAGTKIGLIWKTQGLPLQQNSGSSDSSNIPSDDESHDFWDDEFLLHEVRCGV